jgi:hypothetical protein
VRARYERRRRMAVLHGHEPPPAPARRDPSASGVAVGRMVYSTCTINPGAHR